MERAGICRQFRVVREVDGVAREGSRVGMLAEEGDERSGCWRCLEVAVDSVRGIAGRGSICAGHSFEGPRRPPLSSEEGREC